MEGEMPPEWMWALDHELNVWFERVEEKRKERFGDSSTDTERTEMMENELSRGRR